MTLPETCGAAGGAISFWLNIMKCDTYAGVISSYTSGKTGLQIYCYSINIVYDKLPYILFTQRIYQENVYFANKVNVHQSILSFLSLPHHFK